MTQPEQRLEIYTIGHSNIPAEQLIAVLSQHTVRLLVDVRSAPYSKYTPQFNREIFGRALQAAGIAYIYAGEHLGGRPKDPACYKNESVPDGHANYLRLVDYDIVAKQPWFLQGIARLLTIASKQSTAIMCSEEDPLQCHRHHLIAKQLVAEGAFVHHLRTQGDSFIANEIFTRAAEIPHQGSLF